MTKAINCVCTDQPTCSTNCNHIYKLYKVIELTTWKSSTLEISINFTKVLGFELFKLKAQSK